MSWQIAANIREMFVDLVATDGKQAFACRSANRKDSLISGFNEALVTLPPIDRTTVVLAISSDFERVALRERWGATTALLATEGFENVLEIGNQSREKLFSFQPSKPTPLISHDLSFGVTERTLANGLVEVNLDEKEIDFVLSKLSLSEIKSIAICLLHSNKNKSHELQLASRVREKGYFVSCSHEFEGNEQVRFKKAAQKSFIGPVLEEFHNEFEKLGFTKKNIDLAADFRKSGDGDQIFITCLEDRIITALVRDGKRIARKRLKVSPLSMMGLDEAGMAHVGPAKVGSEPGPVILGKGLALTYFDTLAYSSKLTLDDSPRIKFDQSRVQRVLAPLAKQLRVTPESCAEMFNELGAVYIATEISLLMEEFHFSHVDCKVTFDGWFANLMATPIISKSAFRKFDVEVLSQWSPTIGLLKEIPKGAFEKLTERGSCKFSSKILDGETHEP